MARHNGNRKHGKRKGFKRIQQAIDRDGGALIINGRKFFSHQMHEAGHAFEDLVAESLAQLESRKAIARFVRHEINSPEDKDGKDFTIWVGEMAIEISFGVSISARKVHAARLKHPHVPQLLMRHYWNEKQIAHEILKAFELMQAA